MVDEAGSGTVSPLYNGLITSASWRTDKPYGSTETDYKGMYMYSYDDKYQIKEANFATPQFSSTAMGMDAFTPEGNMFRLAGMQYDPNGNIEKLKRYNDKALRVHDFTYAYQPNTNKLTSVSAYANQYIYNKIGQTVGIDKADEEEDNQYIVYDVTGKVQEVYIGSGSVIRPPSDPGGGGGSSPGAQVPIGFTLRVYNVYDDRGFRLAKTSYPTDDEKAEGDTTRTTWYIRDASGNVLSMYETVGTWDSPNTSEVTQTEIPVYASGKVGTYYPEQDGSIEYEITDHLGNVRALIRDNETIYLATMEDNLQESIDNPRVEEMQYFQNLFETEADFAQMNYSAATATVPDPDKAAYLYWVDGMAGMEAVDKSVGPAIALKVNAGDELKLETWARFEEKVSYSGLDLASLATLVSGSYTGLQGFEGYSLSQTSQSLLGGLQLAGYPQDTDNDLPFAFLNYILYNKDMTVQDAGWVRVSSAAGFEPGMEGLPNNRSHERVAFADPVKVASDGYVYVWVSNQSQATKVWFDDLKITHTTTQVIQSTDYGTWGDVMREQRANELSWAAEPETCVPCSDLRTHVTDYVNAHGEAGLLDRELLASYLNEHLFLKRTVDEYQQAISECRITQTYASFNGGTYVDFGQQPQYLMGTTDFTIEAWVKFPSSIGNGVYPIVANQDYITNNGNTFTGFNLSLFEKQLYFVVGDGDNYAAIRTSSLPSFDEWHQVVVQRIGNDANNYKIYIDGSEILSKVIARNALTSGHIDEDGVEALKIGSRAGSYDNTSFIGSIKDVRIFKRILSWDEVGAIYGSGCGATPGSLAGLVLWAPLDDGTGAAAHDLSIFNNTGNFIGNNYTWRSEIKEDYCLLGDAQVLCTSNYFKRSKYRYGYQGQFAEKDNETGWNHFELREYDPVIGRWTSMDPYGQFYSPYVGMGNDAANGIDSNGGSTDRPSVDDGVVVTGSRIYDPFSTPAPGAAQNILNNYINSPVIDMLNIYHTIQPVTVTCHPKQWSNDFVTEPLVDLSSVWNSGAWQKLFPDPNPNVTYMEVSPVLFLFEFPAAGFTLAGGLGGRTLPMTVEKILPQGTKISEIVNDVKGMTWTTGNEHAVVRLANGQKAIVSGGPGGISFQKGQITTLFGHSHPTYAPASAADYQSLQILGQSRQYVIHGGQTTLIRP